jgi:glycosyltransferase involved in cell wall biosynthesis
MTVAALSAGKNPDSPRSVPSCDHRQYVSFVIPAHNEERMLGPLLNSIHRLRSVPNVVVREIIVADAESTDGTAGIANAAGCHVVDTTRGSASVARNAGAAAASGDLLAFVDADCVLPEDWLVTIVQEFTGDNVVAAATRMAPPPHSASWPSRAWHEVTCNSGAACDATWLPSFNLVVMANAFRNAGGFDESLVTCEDVELGLRLNSTGRLRYVEGQEVHHSGASESWTEFFHREAWRASGSLSLLRQHWNNPREVISTIVPFVVTFMLIVCGVSMLVSVVPQLSLAAWNNWTLAFGLGCGPVMLMLLAIRQRVPIRRLPQAMAILATYCAARSVGSVAVVARVRR